MEAAGSKHESRAHERDKYDVEVVEGYEVEALFGKEGRVSLEPVPSFDEWPKHDCDRAPLCYKEAKLNSELAAVS